MATQIEFSSSTKLALQRALRRGIRMIGSYASRVFMLQSGMRRGRGRAKSHPTMLTWRTGKLGRSLRDIGSSPDSFILFTDTTNGVMASFGTNVRYARPHEDPNGWKARNGRHVQSRPFLRPAYYKFQQEGGWDNILRKDLKGTDIARYVVYDMKKYFSTILDAKLK